MSASPRPTPTSHDLFMGVWYSHMSQTGGRGITEIVHWAKVWINCCELAGRLEEMEEKAAEDEANTPESWPPRRD